MLKYGTCFENQKGQRLTGHCDLVQHIYEYQFSAWQKKTTYSFLNRNESIMENALACLKNKTRQRCSNTDEWWSFTFIILIRNWIVHIFTAHHLYTHVKFMKHISVLKLKCIHSFFGVVNRPVIFGCMFVNRNASLYINYLDR